MAIHHAAPVGSLLQPTFDAEDLVRDAAPFKAIGNDAVDAAPRWAG
ncbi:hypothetical protein [Streptomyces chartreusis]